MLPLTLSLLLASQEPQTPVQTPIPAPVAPNFQAAIPVAEPTRLALTPKTDGVIEPEEWDPLASDGAKTYFQWEPGKIHVAGVVPEGSDLLISLDLKGNGWLVGNDNYEIRATLHDGGVRVYGSLIDATHVDGPKRIDLPGIQSGSIVASKTEGGMTTYELSLSDGGQGVFPKSERKIAVRVDAVPAAIPTPEPFVPRVLAPVTLAMTRAAALPSGLKWGVEGEGSSVVPGDSTRIRFTFNGTDKMGFQRFSMRTEGLARASTGDSAVPFPPFDNKSRAFVDYNTPVSRDALEGYRIVQGSLAGSDGVTGLIQASYRIAPLLELTMQGDKLKASADSRKIRLTYVVSSNSTSNRRTDGNVRIVPPSNFTVVTGDDRDFSVFSPKGNVRRVFELQVPPSVTGVFPIGFRMEVNGKVVESTGYLHIEVGTKGE